MRLIGRAKGRKFFAEEIEGYGYTLSTMEEVQSGRRPMNYYATRQELEQAAAERGGEVVWQTT